VKPAQPDLNQLLGARYNSMLEHRHLAARLRQRVPPHAATIALEAILRRDQFEPRARIELFEDLSTYFRRLVEFPAESTEQLSDEQYVRNVAEILFVRA
jgi:LytS/YehU family sensor histidine kinase